MSLRPDVLRQPAVVGGGLVGQAGHMSPTRELGRRRGSSSTVRRAPAPLPILVVANAISLSGNVIATVAIPWLVLTTTGSAALTGVAVFAAAGAAAVGGLVAGRIVDAIGPVRTSAAADLLSGLAVVPLPILLMFDVVQLWQIALLMVAGTLVDSAGSTARQSLVPAAADAGGAPRERANALFTSGEHLGYLLGAPVAGLLIGLLGIAATLWVTVATFLVAAALVGVLVRLPAAVTADGIGGEPVGLQEAVAFIRRDPALRALVIFPTICTLLIGPLVPIVLPVMAREAFGDPLVLGIMVSAFGSGGLIGALAFGAIGRRIPRRRLYTGVMVVWPMLYATLALVPSLAASVLALVILGIAAGSLVPMQATIRQKRSTPRLLPRVVGLSTATVPVVGPLAVLAAGVLLDALGVRGTLLLMTIGTACIGIAALRSAGIRAFDGVPGAQQATAAAMPVTAAALA
jgi:predicted MFS family arabinose efflux permease